MKSTPALLLIAVLLAACGQTGALYLPKQPVKPDAKADSPLGKPGVAPPSAPVPSTPPASQQ